MLVKALGKDVDSGGLTQVDIWDASLPDWNRHLEGLSAQDRVAWACEEFGDGVVLSSSFGIQSAVMLHLVSQVRKDIPVIFIDTGYLFPETYRFARDLTERLGLHLKKYVPATTAAEQEALYGKLWEQGVDGLNRYNLMNKVEPMNRAIRELGAVVWMAGLRRDQAGSREKLQWIQRQNRILKLHPILEWNNRDVYRYLTKHDLPYHPLWEKGYVSVGDWHSSRPLEAGMKEEDTRFGGIKRECGLHELSKQPDFQI
jgi:phosphoadenosine phosphosulfate reductase